MNQTESIIQIDAETKHENTHYNDYAIVVHAIKQRLKRHTNISFHMYKDDENEEEIWDVVEDDLTNNSSEVELVSHVYDCIETKSIHLERAGGQPNFLIKNSLSNSVYYYPKYKVALARIPVFQAHSDYEIGYVFAENDEDLRQFLHYVFKRQREYIQNNVTVFTDTEDGVERSKERITNLVTRDDVFLEEDLKSEIYRSIDEFFNKSGDFFKKYDIPYKRGILLYGNPGNGKTTLVKSIAGSISAPVAYWQITEYTSSYSINEVFETVSKMSPMVLVIEDIDSMPEHVRSVFLNSLDGATSKEGTFLIGTTNYPERIDPALINRAGRFDRAYEIKRPDDQLRLKYLLKRKLTQFLPKHEVENTAKVTEGFSMAQLNELYTATALQWHYENTVDIVKIVNELKADNKKSKSNNWETEDLKEKVGFGV
ncbi:ATPase [Pueribacillus theae]|uniref:ATPase n=1 Tax=Pueribacillus theae TaxID=2171751 RepID=A0A2U1K6Q4_9BACI|nr:ATP-binding protein [Pueribacillus theae]PWA13082.1 ATPase [Pueribacillus theae]